VRHVATGYCERTSGCASEQFSARPRARNRDRARDCENPSARPRVRVPALDAAQQEQDYHDEQDEAEAPARVVAPAAAVRPSWRGPDEQKDQDDEQNESHAVSSISGLFGGGRRGSLVEFLCKAAARVNIHFQGEDKLLLKAQSGPMLSQRRRMITMAEVQRGVLLRVFQL